MISIENASKSFGSQVLFDQISFKLNHKERVGLVGRNGRGKTTLFKMIIGEEMPDSGSITIPKLYKIGYVSQILSFSESSILNEVMLSLPEEEKDHYWKVEKILSGLGFNQNDMNKPPNVFSGGFQVRLNLAKMLVAEPDLLLLDEPTNYLDITSIRWLERFLISWPRELLLITHDRSFMDKVVTHTMIIHRQTIRKMIGNTEKLYAQIELDEDIYEKTRLNEEKKRKELELFITRFRAKARLANLVQSRVKTLEKMQKRDKLEQLKNLSFSFRYEPLKAKYIVTAENISFSYQSSHPIIQHFNITIQNNDRICIIGKNGKGKTTLLKLLSGNIHTQSGMITQHQDVQHGIFVQTNVNTLNENYTVEQEIMLSHKDIDRQGARNICGAMMFEGDHADKKIKVLSGGEKSRVMLGKILATPVNLLFLDEPTNHLDMESCDSLLQAIDQFKGAVLMVTHNELFLHTLAKRLIIFQNNSIMIFEGSYQDFLDKHGWEDELEDQTLQKPIKLETKTNKKEQRRLRSQLITERSKILKPLEEKIRLIEDTIENHEKELEILHKAMQDASMAQDGKKISEISQKIHPCQKRIDDLFDELEKVTDQYDQQRAEFNIENS